MTSTISTGRQVAETPERPPRRPSSSSPSPTRPSRNRRPLVAAASAGLVCLSIAAFVSLYSSAQRTNSVLVAARTIPEGQVFTKSDLHAVDVATPSGVATVSTADADTVIGHRSAVTVPAGTLLVAADLTTGSSIPAGDAIVGVALKDGEFPPAGLAPGQQVLVVETFGSSASLPSVTSSSPGASVEPTAGIPSVTLAPTATVVTSASPVSPSSGTTLLVGLAVPVASAGPVAVAAAAGQVSLVLVPSTGKGSSQAPLPGGLSTGGPA